MRNLMAATIFPTQHVMNACMARVPAYLTAIIIPVKQSLTFHFKLTATENMLANLSFCYGDFKQGQAITTLKAISAGVNDDVVIE